MINLDNLNMVLFDFDDTLYIHDHHYHGLQNTLELSILAGDQVYKDDRINTQMKEFVQMCDKADILLGLLSATPYMVTANEKIRWANRVYGVTFENYCVGDAEHKVKMLELLSTANHFKPESIAIVDDLGSTLHAAEKHGFTALTPMEVVNYVNLKRFC